MDPAHFLDDLTHGHLFGWKTAVATLIIALAALQVALAARFSGIGGLPVAPSAAAAWHRWNGRTILVLTLVVGAVCLVGPAGPLSPVRILAHTVLGAGLFVLFAVKLLTVRSSRHGARLPALGMALFATYVLVWLTSVADFVLDGTADPGPSVALKVWVAATALVAAVLGGVGIGGFVASGSAAGARPRNRPNPRPEPPHVAWDRACGHDAGVEPDDDEVGRAASVLRDGGLVAFPTETVYGLGADAGRPEAVRRIFAAKGRPADHPVIVHLGSVAELDEWALDVPTPAKLLADAFWPGPLTLLLPRGARVPDEVTGGRPSVGLRVPDHPLALRLLRAFGGGVAAPSANRFGRGEPDHRGRASGRSSAPASTSCWTAARAASGSSRPSST